MPHDLSTGKHRHKDYRELVSFPVEIIANDGSVRRFPFEDAVAMYQRRVDYASSRFPDPLEAEAERGHCMKRVEQLRMSYFHRFGWVDGGGRFGPHEGEVAAFLRRILAVEGRLDLTFGPGGDLGQEVHVVDCPEGLKVYYVHEADEEGGARSILRGELHTLGGNVSAGEQQTEHLLAMHQGEDFLVGLTGRWEHVQQLSVQPYRPDLCEVASVVPSPWDATWSALREGKYKEALDECSLFIETHPWHGPGRASGMLLAVYLDDGDAFCRLRPEVGSPLSRESEVQWAQAMADLASGTPCAPLQDLKDSGGARWPAVASMNLVVRASGRMFPRLGRRGERGQDWSREHRSLRRAIVLSRIAVLIFVAAVLKIHDFEAWVGGGLVFSALGWYAAGLWVRQAVTRLTESLVGAAIPVMLRRLARAGLPTVYAPSQTE
jgi:hypothetical protein